MQIVTGTRVDNLAESIVASGLPMKTSYSEVAFKEAVEAVRRDIRDHGTDKMFTSKDILRAIRLGSAKQCSGHDNFLSGITVFMDISATVKWWQQFQRYHFAQIVSSMSTMHKLKNMVEEGTIQFHPATIPSVIEAFLKTVKEEENLTYETLSYSCPMGLIMTASVTTNYLQLKNMWCQRRWHKLKEWQDFCDWIESLPLFVELTGIDVQVKEKEK